MSETVLETAPGPVPQPSLSDQERTNLQRMLAFPLDLPPEFITYMEERMRLLLSADNIIGMAQRLATVGEYKDIAKDLTAQTGLYVWEDSQGAWLYTNGADITGAGYDELEAFLGGVILPDTRGRELVYCGTHADVTLLDTFGAATEASRRGPKHGHAITSLTVTGAPAVGSLALPNHVHAVTDPGHDHQVTPSTVAGGSALYEGTAANQQAPQSTAVEPNTTGITIGNPTTLPAISGAPGLGTLDVGGTVGIDTLEGGAAIVIGSRLIKA